MNRKKDLLYKFEISMISMRKSKLKNESIQSIMSNGFECHLQRAIKAQSGYTKELRETKQQISGNG